MRERHIQKVSLGDRIGIGLDKCLAILAPKTAYRRMMFRRANSIMASGSYRGSRVDRLKSSWLPGSGSADEDLLPDLAMLRERSRDLNRNDAHASGITETVTINTVGTGISVQSRIDAEALGMTDEAASALQKRCERIFTKWTPFADAGERMDFFDMQNLIDRQILESGEAIFLPVMIEKANRPYYIALDMIEPDRLATPPSKTGDKSIRNGVELGKFGEPVAYYIKKTHPGDVMYAKGYATDDYTKIPAVNKFGRKNVYHIYTVLRPGQTRGVPFFAPVLNYFKDLGDYMEAEVVAARVAACLALFVKQEDQLSAAAANSSETNGSGQRLEALEPGMIKYLGPGQDITAFNPMRPNQMFDQFVYSVLRAISTGLNLPYEIVSKDFSRTNYSSARAALLQAYRYFRRRQKILSSKFCQPAYEMVIEEAWLRGEIDMPDFYAKKYEYTRSKWIGSGWQWVDPKKEAEASNLAIANGLSTLADECASQGKDWEETIEQRAREAAKVKELEEKYDVSIITQDTPAAIPQPASDNPDAPQDETISPAEQNPGGNE